MNPTHSPMNNNMNNDNMNNNNMNNNNHQDMNNNNNMSGMNMSGMNTAFYSSINVGEFLFQGVTITTVNQYVLVTLIIIITCVIQELITLLRIKCKRDLKKKQRKCYIQKNTNTISFKELSTTTTHDCSSTALATPISVSSTNNSNSESDANSENDNDNDTPMMMNVFFHEMLVMVLYAMNLAISYILMLVVMTYNLGFFLAGMCTTTNTITTTNDNNKWTIYIRLVVLFSPASLSLLLSLFLLLLFVQLSLAYH